MSGSDKLLVNRIPKSITLSLSYDELKVLDRWLGAAAQLQPARNRSNALLIILLSRAWMKTQRLLITQKDTVKVSLTVEESLALHNLIKTSDPTYDMYEYAVITNIYANIDRVITAAL